MNSPRRRVNDLDTWSTDPSSSPRKVLTREISIQKDIVVFIFGVQSSNIRRLTSLPGVIDVRVDNERCVVTVKALTAAALDTVEVDIQSLMVRVKLLGKMTCTWSRSMGLQIVDKTANQAYKFRTSHECIFEVMRFCVLFGIDPKYIQEGNIISADHIEKNKLEEIFDFQKYWNENAIFVDIEEMWNRKRPLILSNFVENLLLSCNFVRSWGSYYKLNTLRCLSGIEYVEIYCHEEDVVLQLTIGARSRSELDSCVLLAKMYFNNYIDSLETLRYGVDVMGSHSGYSFCVPYACRAEQLRKKNKLSRISYLEKIYKDPEVTFVELNEKEQTLTLGCSSQGRLDRLLFEVRGYISLFKAFAWRKTYHASFCCYIKISDEQRQMDAIFQDVSENVKLRLAADFTDVVDDHDSCGSLKYIRLLNPVIRYQGMLHSNSLSRTRYSLYIESALVTEFVRFLRFNDFPFLHNLTAFTRFGFTLYRMTNSKRQSLKSVCELFSSWEENFYGEFSFDLSSSFKKVFDTSYLLEDLREINQQSLIEVFYSDLGNNIRYMTRIDSAGRPLLEEAITYSHCRSDHCHGRVIDIDCSKCSKQIIVSSQKPCDNVRAKDFVEDSIRSGELLAENVMSLNSYYSMYNVSIVKRTVLQYRDFIIHLDSVSKKSNQRYGKFSDVVHLTLYYPRLNETICQLQENPGDESLMKCAAELYEELISASDRFSAVIDRFIESS